MTGSTRDSRALAPSPLFPYTVRLLPLIEPSHSRSRIDSAWRTRNITDQPERTANDNAARRGRFVNNGDLGCPRQLELVVAEA